MLGKIILNIAISLNGYIAKEDGSFDWIKGNDKDDLNTEEKFIFSDFLNEIDVVVMGRNCYEQNFHKDFENKTVYIATSKIEKDYDNIKFANNNIVDIILEEKNKGKNIYLFGGGILIDSFLKCDVIDEYIIGIIPTILGEGKKLFLNNNPNILLNLQNYYIENDVTILKYNKK